jgi:DNA processing protein
VNASLCVVSGIAAGIDRFAHLGSLDAKGPTVAVLPYGIDMRAPLMNKDIFFLIESSPHCAIISEHPPGIHAEKWMFVKRNRIISGLSRVTVVVKAGEKSGALATAKYALDQGREVFACGGLPFDPGYAGCQNLIRDGAWIVSDMKDIIRCAGGSCGEKTLFDDPSRFQVRIPEYPPGSTEEKMIHKLKSGEEDIDTLIRDCKIPPAEAQRAAVCLEIAGIISRHGTRMMLQSVKR